jgi:hypothetical protein
VKISLSLLGFTETEGFRVFSFECVTSDQSRIRHTVSADLRLLRQYRIPIQELPLLCQGLLEQAGDGEMPLELIFGEPAMLSYAQRCAAAKEKAAQKKLAGRKSHFTSRSEGKVKDSDN